MQRFVEFNSTTLNKISFASPHAPRDRSPDYRSPLHLSLSSALSLTHSPFLDRPLVELRRARAKSAAYIGALLGLSACASFRTLTFTFTFRGASLTRTVGCLLKIQNSHAVSTHIETHKQHTYTSGRTKKRIHMRA